MSLLLDALRRAGRDRDGAGAGEADSLDLPDPAGAPGPAGSADGERAKAAQLLGGGGRPGMRTGLLVGAAALGALALLGAGGWYYFQTMRADIDRSLAAYDPGREPAEPAAGTAADLDPPPGDDAGSGGQGDAAAASAGAGNRTAPNPDATGERTAGSGDAGTGADPAAGETQTADAGAATGQAVDGGTAAPADEPTATASASEARTGDTSAADAAQTDAREEPAADDDAAPAGEAPPSGATAADANGAPADPAPAGETATARTADGGGADADPATVGATAEGNGNAPVVRSGSDSPVADALRTGYRAYRRGDFDAARQAYGRALDLAPGNRDARLGAAAVALADGNTAAARRHYERVLADDPRDPYARAGLARTGRLTDGDDRESALRDLLRRHPRAHGLRFELGNLYADRGRWNDARVAYAEALETAPGEADYAYNLAVALDHLGRRDAARRLYERALTLADGDGASFPIEAATRRLEGLQP